MARKSNVREEFRGGYFAGEGPLPPLPKAWLEAGPVSAESERVTDLEKALLEAVRAVERGHPGTSAREPSPGRSSETADQPSSRKLVEEDERESRTR
ncbi:MAG TPA: hypothetical protein VHN37_03050 [Actinomycetota bacterium]|nr:hypothetical protein [Actinomycetota bacterium]